MIEFVCPDPCLIDKVAGEFGALSNMSPHPIDWPTVDGSTVRWPRAEQLFQALRFAPGHPVQAMLLAESNPMRAKMLVKPHLSAVIVGLRSDQDLWNMRSILKAKVLQYESVYRLLQQTGQRRIVEDCSRRASESGLFWGATRVDYQHTWRGQNTLGELWMAVRDELFRGAACA